MKLLITGAWVDAKNHLSELQSLGHEVVFMQNESENLPCDPLWVEGVICNGLFLSHDISAFQNLKYIQLTSAGYDRVPMEYVTAHNITIHNARGVYSIPMAEYALCGVLALYKQSRFFLKNQMQHKWEKHRGLIELHGKTVCIVGCGSVGTECAKRFSAFGTVVRGIDLLPRKADEYREILPLDALNEVLPSADIVVLTLPLTDSTKHLFDRKRFEQMKWGAILVNIARGVIVDTEALVRALQTNKLGGAVLDVFEEEPLPKDNPLWSFDNVMITPHNSFAGDGNEDRLFHIIESSLKGSF